MKHPTLKTILLDHINSTGNWISKGELGLITERAGYLPESCGRHLRLMAESGEISVSYYKGARNQTLSRYARIGEVKLEPKKPQIILTEINGQMVAKMIEVSGEVRNIKFV